MPMNQDKIKKALDAVKNGMSINNASKVYGIAKTTLHRRYTTHMDLDKTPGAPPVWSKSQEEHLCTWIIHMSTTGFAISKDLLLDSVAKLIKDLQVKNNFKKGRPGR